MIRMYIFLSVKFIKYDLQHLTIQNYKNFLLKKYLTVFKFIRNLIFFKKNLSNLCRVQKLHYICIRNQETRALSSAGSEHLVYTQRVGGSNPSAPTKEVQKGPLFAFIYFFT